MEAGQPLTVATSYDLLTSSIQYVCITDTNCLRMTDLDYFDAYRVYRLVNCSNNSNGIMMDA
jgi:hypothetical protein